MWLTGCLAPNFKTIADFRRDNGRGIRQACSQFVAICRNLKLLVDGVVAVDGSKFKAVNNRDRNVTPHKMEQRLKQIQKIIDRYMQSLDTADRTSPIISPLGVRGFRTSRSDWSRRSVASGTKPARSRSPTSS